MGVLSELSDAPLSQVYHMAVDAKKRVFVPDFNESVVLVFVADGSFANRIGRRGMRTITSFQLGTCMTRTNQTIKLSDGSSRIARGTCCKQLTNCRRRKTSGSVPSSIRWRGDHQCPIPVSFGAEELRADGPNDTHALAGSGRNSVRWFSPSGAPVHTIVQNVTGPELSLQDRLAGDSAFVRIAKEAHTAAPVPFKLPERKPPLYNIFFDAGGRLWVQHTTLRGAVQTADVYGTDGSLAFHVAWSVGVGIPNNEYVRGKSAWGVQLDDNDVPHIVRIEFTGGR